MATVKLTPSSYGVSSTTYISVSNASNMYHDVSNTTYATFYNSRTSTTTYYGYIHGFNVDSIPDEAIVSSFTIRIKGYESGAVTSTGTTYAICLINGTTAIANTYSTTQFGTSVKTIEVPHTNITWESLKEYGSNLGIRICIRRSSKNTAAYVYIYGAEIEVEYTIPSSATVTSTLTGNGTIEPSGATSTYEGAEYTLTITPTNKSDTVTATKNGVDITSELVAHGSDATITATPESVTTHSIQSGSSYAQYAVGHSAESPYSSTSNMYASSGSTGYAEYSFDFSDIPSNATIEQIEVRCHGHRESSTISSTYVSQCAIYNSSTAVSDKVDFPSTSASIITLEPNTTITRSQLDNLTVRHFVGYYGGLVTGISFEVKYSTGSGIDHYTYTTTVDGNMTIAVTIGGGGSQPKFYVKINGTWTQFSKIYKKINGSWVEQSSSTWSTLFDTNTNYRKME